MYTSKLPISTSARRPTSQGDHGSTSFASTTYRPSNIPVTAKKANLFTPQTKRPFQTGYSTASKSYLSTGIATEKKYQHPLRPMPDRDQQIRMFNKLLEYIKANAPHLQPPDQKKFFSSVSTTESSRIFEFLISRIIPGFQISKLEMDVPEALAILEYPYIRSVTKSTLVSVTTEKAVVGLLRIFDWLIDSASNQQSLDSLEDDEEDVDLANLKHARFYPDSVQAGAQELADKLHSSQDIGLKEQERMQIKIENEQLSEDTNIRLQKLDQDKAFEEDINKCDEYEAQMKKYNETKQKAINEHKRETIEISEEQLTYKERQQALQAKINTHCLLINELERKHTEVEKLEKEVAVETKEHEILIEELNQLREKSSCSDEKSRNSVGESRDILEEYLELYDSLGYKSETWSKIRPKWYSIVQQAPPDEPAEVERLFREHDLFWEGLEATMPDFKSVIQAERTKLGDTSEKTLVAIAEARKKSDHFLEAVRREDREKERVIVRCKEKMEKLNLDYENAEKRLILLQESSRKKLAMLEKRRKEDRLLLDGDNKGLQEMSELEEQRLESVLERHRAGAEMLVKYMERSCEKWQKIKEVNEFNKQIISVFHKKLKKRRG